MGGKGYHFTPEAAEGLDYGWQGPKYYSKDAEALDFGLSRAKINSQRPPRWLIMVGKGQNIIPRVAEALDVGGKG